MLTDAEIQITVNSLNATIASCKRMQNQKPKYSAVFQDEINDINKIIQKITAPPAQRK